MSCAPKGIGSIILAIQKTKILIAVILPSMFSIHFLLTVGIKSKATTN